MQHKNLLIPPESEPTPFVTAFSMSRMQFPMIWDVGLRGAEGRMFLNKEHEQGCVNKGYVQKGDSYPQKPELLSRLNLISFSSFLI